MFKKENRTNTLNGILFVSLFSLAAIQISQMGFVKNLGLSPLIVGIVIGIFYANTLRHKLPKEWVPGILFCTKNILRFAIVLYGFRITFQNIFAVGMCGIVVSVFIVFSTFIIGYLIGTKILKLDRDTAILTSVGSSICGAAAVLATEPVINAKPYKSAVAVATVVIFGTTAMFLYPFLYKAGVIPFTPEEMGVYIGGTIHEVAHVVGAGIAVSADTAKTAVIVKMIRVMMIAPFLILLGLWLSFKGENSKKTVTIPWFAVFFILTAGFNSLNVLSAGTVEMINSFDTFLLTMAVTALGMETTVEKFKNMGMKPVYLAFILFVWLIFGGYFIVNTAFNTF
ncbi:YeiH family protein [Nautilia sp.]